MSSQTPAGDPPAQAEPLPRTGPTPALITALATQLATMLVADLRDKDRSDPPKPTAPSSGPGQAAPNSAGPAAEGGADGA